MASNRKSSKKVPVNASSPREPRMERDRTGDQETMANLRQHVAEMKKSRGRAVEMRLAVLVSIAVGLKVFYMETLLESTAAYSVFFFMLIAVLIIILTTWLDYFPSRLGSVGMRPAEGQGLPLSCLLPPMTCIAVLCHTSLHYPQLTDIISLYLVLCCTVSLATMIPTLVHSAPYPNSIVLYNLLLMVLILGVNTVLETPIFPLSCHCILYSLLVPFLLHSFPESFTLCEVSLISQGISLLMTDTLLQVTHKMGWYELPTSLIIERSYAFLYLEFGVTGFVLCCTIFSYFLYKLASTDDSFYRHIWSLVFLQASFLFSFFILLPCLQLIIGESPTLWLFKFLLSTRQRVYMILYWMGVVSLTGLLVYAQSSHSPRMLNFLKSENPSSLWMRKWFHILALLVYVPGLMMDPPLLSVCSAVVTVAFVFIELIRLFRIWPFGDGIHSLLIPFVDSRDSGDLILTHTYLLLGFSLPIWLYYIKPGTSLVSKLSMYSGVLSLGVGDSIAAVSGTLVGSHKWPGTSKTFEGSFMSVICQLIIGAGIVMMDTALPSLSQYSWFILVASIVGGAAMEAYTHQVDNLIIGIFQFIICIAFL